MLTAPSAQREPNGRQEDCLYIATQTASKPFPGPTCDRDGLVGASKSSSLPQSASNTLVACCPIPTTAQDPHVHQRASTPGTHCVLPLSAQGTAVFVVAASVVSWVLLLFLCVCPQTQITAPASPRTPPSVAGPLSALGSCG